MSIVDEVVLAFVEVLRCSWIHVYQLGVRTTPDDVDRFCSDWAQATWEMMVEAALSTNGALFLEPYGEGADCNDIGSRVWHPGVQSTHAIHILPKVGTTIRDMLTGDELTLPPDGIPLDRFCTTTEGGWYVEHVPFDHVLGFSGEREVVVRFDEIACKLIRL